MASEMATRRAERGTPIMVLMDLTGDKLLKNIDNGIYQAMNASVDRYIVSRLAIDMAPSRRIKECILETLGTTGENGKLATSIEALIRNGFIGMGDNQKRHSVSLFMKQKGEEKMRHLRSEPKLIEHFNNALFTSEAVARGFLKKNGHEIYHTDKFKEHYMKYMRIKRR
ncbi:MAG: hypothetical protein KGH98_03785 [Candidatus Micrarchaeota archaeon]|nr:hypothetical protein [Candidatus Micrarchaeota archaeon]